MPPTVLSLGWPTLLWYKAWRETRARFLLSAGALAALAVAFVLFRPDVAGGLAERPLPYAEYVWRSTYKGYLRELFVVLAVVLGVGGLRHEGAVGTAGFTLVLPVSRARLLATRALVGLAEVAALAAVPAVVFPALSPVIGEHYPLSQALAFGLLWAVSGALWYGLGVVASALADGAYTALAGAFMLLLLYSAVADVPVLEGHVADLHDVMSGSGMPYFRADTSMLVGPLPWRTLATVLLVALGLLAVADRLTRTRDF